MSLKGVIEKQIRVRYVNLNPSGKVNCSSQKCQHGTILKDIILSFNTFVQDTHGS